MLATLGAGRRRSGPASVSATSWEEYGSRGRGSGSWYGRGCSGRAFGTSRRFRRNALRNAIPRAREARKSPRSACCPVVVSPPRFEPPTRRFSSPRPAFRPLASRCSFGSDRQTSRTRVGNTACKRLSRGTSPRCTPLRPPSARHEAQRHGVRLPVVQHEPPPHPLATARHAPREAVARRVVGPRAVWCSQFPPLAAPPAISDRPTPRCRARNLVT